MIRSSSMRLRIAASPLIYRDGSARIRRFGSLKALSTAERSKEIAVGREGECNEHTRPAVPPPTSIRPRSGRIVSPIDNVRRRRCRARRRVASHSGDNATAPRSARSGWRYRGSREGSLRSPARDPRLFPSTAPRSLSRAKLQSDKGAKEPEPTAQAVGYVDPVANAPGSDSDATPGTGRRRTRQSPIRPSRAPTDRASSRGSPTPPRST